MWCLPPAGATSTRWTSDRWVIKTHSAGLAFASRLTQLTAMTQISASGGGVCRSFSVGEEEANHVAVHPKGDLLAAATDAGEIAIIKLGTGARQRTLRRVHTNIVSSVAWRPQRQADLLTTSLDATAVSWDVSNGSVRRSWVLRDAIMDVQLREKPPLATSSDWSHLQMVNPPLGHSVRCCGSQTRA